MPRVLIVCEYPTISGGERSLLGLAKLLQAAGMELLAACPPAGPLACQFARLGVAVLPFSPRCRGARRPLGELREELSALMRRAAPELVHANSLAMSRLSGPVVRELGLPGLGHLRDIVKLGPQAVADLNCHTRLLAVSQATRQFHLQQGLCPEKTQVLYNGVDLDQFRPRAPTGWLHRELGLPRGAKLLGTIGQICLRKGHDLLVRAAKAVCAQHPDAHFLVVGQRWSEKPESQAFEAALEQAAAGPLAGHMHLLGQRDDVAELLNELTLLVHPARQEPLGRVLLEAAAAGVAVVTTATGGTPEIFPPGSEAACLVPPDNAPALAQAILGLLADPHQLRRIAEAARQRAEEAFDLRRAGAGLLGHYRELLGICPNQEHHLPGT